MRVMAVADKDSRGAHRNRAILQPFLMIHISNNGNRTFKLSVSKSVEIDSVGTTYRYHLHRSRSTGLEPVIGTVDGLPRRVKKVSKFKAGFERKNWDGLPADA